MGAPNNEAMAEFYSECLVKLICILNVSDTTKPFVETYSEHLHPSLFLDKVHRKEGRIGLSSLLLASAGKKEMIPFVPRSTDDDR